MSAARLLCLAWAVTGLTACGPGPSPSSTGSVSVTLRQQADGLFYKEGTATPYTGPVLTFTKAGVKESREHYRQGRPDHTWERYWPNGKVKREQRFVDGQQTLQRQWYEDGTLKEEIEMKGGVRCGKVRLWWPDGRLRRTSIVGSYARVHGHAMEYAEDGTLLTDAIFHHGLHISGPLHKEGIANPSADLTE